MINRNTKLLAIALPMALLAAACTSSQSESATSEEMEPAHIEAVSGSSLSRVTFSETAMQRVGIETATVGSGRIDRGDRKIIPYGALLYDSRGETWVYQVVAPRTFMRHQVSVDRIADDKVYLLDGPDLGIEIVTVGAAEVFGAEFEVGH